MTTKLPDAVIGSGEGPGARVTYVLPRVGGAFPDPMYTWHRLAAIDGLRREAERLETVAVSQELFSLHAAVRIAAALNQNFPEWCGAFLIGASRPSVVAALEPGGPCFLVFPERKALYASRGLVTTAPDLDAMGPIVALRARLLVTVGEPCDPPELEPAVDLITSIHQDMDDMLALQTMGRLI
jgi:hypothetical protein